MKRSSLLNLLVLLAIVPVAIAPAATVTGTLQDALGDAVQTGIIITSPNVSSLPPAVIPAFRHRFTNSANGTFSISLATGNYLMQIQDRTVANIQSQFSFFVPAGTGSYDIADLISVAGNFFNQRLTIQEADGNPILHNITNLTVSNGTLTSNGVQSATLTIGGGDGAGTITSVVAGSGLSGGGASGDVTLNVGAGSGITVSASDVAIATGGVTSAHILDGTIVNADISASAAIAASKVQHLTGVTSDVQTQLGTKIGGALTATRVPFATGASTVTDSAGFTFDGSTLTVPAVDVTGTVTAPVFAGPLWQYAGTIAGTNNSTGTSLSLGSSVNFYSPANFAFYSTSQFFNVRESAGSAVLEHGPSTGDIVVRAFASGNESGNVIINDIGGNIGLGTNAPSERVEVLGNVKATGFIGEASGLTAFPANVALRDEQNTMTALLESTHSMRIAGSLRYSEEVTPNLNWSASSSFWKRYSTNASYTVSETGSAVAGQFQSLKIENTHGSNPITVTIPSSKDMTLWPHTFVTQMSLRPGEVLLVTFYYTGSEYQIYWTSGENEDLAALAAEGSTGSGPFVRAAGSTLTSVTLDELDVNNLLLPELVSAAATPDTGKLAIYALDDGNVYSKDDAGTVVNLSAAAGTGTTNAAQIYVTNSPTAYTPATSFTEGHLKGVDDALAALGAWSPLVTDTTSTTVTPLHTNSVTADVTRYSQARVIATQRTNSAAFFVSAQANNTGGSLVIVTNTIERLTNSVSASWDAYFTASGANMLLNAKGPAAEGVSWKVVQFNTWTHTNYLAALSPYFFEDFFEDASINAATWPEIIGGSITASTSNPLDGTRSLLVADPASGANYITSLDIGENHETVHFGFLINISTPTLDRNIIRIRNSANDADLAQVTVTSSRTPRVQATGGSLSTASLNVIPNTAGVSIPMLVRYTRGTGSNAEILVASSVDNVNWTSSRFSNNGTSTEYARRLRFINNSAWDMGIRIDNVIAKSAEPTVAEVLAGP